MSRYQEILKEIRQAAITSSRRISDVQLIAVTKTVTWDVASHLYQEGLRDFAENRLPHALENISQAPKDCRWHFIGSLQSNKVQKVISNFVLIHSVDSEKLLDKISQCSQQMGCITHVLLQVNPLMEGSKHGMSIEDCLEMYPKFIIKPSIAIKGLMAMAPNTQEEAIIRDCFRKTCLLRDTLNARYPENRLEHLSMGMSNDYKIAIEEGATIIRIGSALFDTIDF